MRPEKHKISAPTSAQTGGVFSGKKASFLLVLALFSLILAILPDFSSFSYAQQGKLDDIQSLEQIHRLLNAEQVQAAGAQLDAINSSGGARIPEVTFLMARYQFLMGDYKKAVAHLDQAIANYGDDPVPAHWDELRGLIRSTFEVTEGYQKFTTPKGHFEIHLPPGKDQVLVPFAAEALDMAYDEIGKELGFYPPTPIRLEVYPQTSTLAKVSSLTEEEIRTSGTIALCKYNRLMITSPRALLQGYGWVDTVVHEYVHYVINAKTQHRVPIWMHEGLAKFLERRWRGPHAEQLPPSAESLLKERVKSGKLITFEQMHPSMAKLPSQDDAAVAFAEVYTVMEYLKREVGQDAFKRLLDHINTGLPADQAFAKTIGEPFSTFEKNWMAYLKTRKTVEVPDGSGYEEKLVFKDQAQGASDLEDIEKPRARQYMQLGEMMQARERWQAALVQYEKAAHLLGGENPVLQTRRAQCLLQENRPKEALKMLESVHALYPSYTQAWVEMGSAALAVKDFARARDYLNEAARINPFDPAVHDRLAEVYTQLGDAKLAEEFRGYAQMVR